MITCPNCDHEFAYDPDEDESFTPWRIDKTTDTLWERIDGEWRDTGETPTEIQRFIGSTTPLTTPLLSALGTGTPKTVTWGFGGDHGAE